MNTEEWDKLSDNHKAKIMKGLAQAEAGLGTPAPEVIKNIREKYGLNKSKDWSDDMSAEEEHEIKEGLKQADNSGVIPHEEVMAKYKNGVLKSPSERINQSAQLPALYFSSPSTTTATQSHRQ